MTSLHSICAIIVIYEPPTSLAQLIERITPQVQSVVIVDNGQNEALRPTLTSVVQWISNPDNGLAKAQNLGIETAKTLGADAILLLDDDSLPAKNMVETLLASYSENDAVIAPQLLEEGTTQPPHAITTDGWLGFQRIQLPQMGKTSRLYYTAASGSLIPLAVLNEIGVFREDFFIYFIDTEFCLRARKAGYEISIANDSMMQHRYGNSKNHRFLGKTIRTTHHSPQARFYMFRNRKKLWKEYLFSQPGYVLFDLLRAISEIIRVSLFEGEKNAKLLAIWRGLLQ